MPASGPLPSTPVRRMATVTISVPEASRASRMTAGEVKRPVPTKRREVKVRPAITSGSEDCNVIMSNHLLTALQQRAARDGPHHEHFITIAERRVLPLAAWHDLAVDRHRDVGGARLTTLCGQQRRHGRGPVELIGLSVQLYRPHV